MEGDLNYKNLQEFNEIFQSVFNDNDEVTINIDGLRSIDRHGVNAIARLHNEAVLNGKLLTIIGLGNKEVHKHLDRTDAA
ncbi:MAG: hypothetical protein HKO96_03605 [Flavobacteriaceae bacterium]|nr:hypothetical protein [Flavobacteriaceae bacterium]